MNVPDAPFYLCLKNDQCKIKKEDDLDNGDEDDDVKEEIWYKAKARGKNPLGSIASDMSKAAGIGGRHTNHSVRRTTVHQLAEAGIQDLDIIALTGHKNISGLKP